MKKFIINITFITLLFVAVDKVFLFVEAKSPDLEFDQRLDKMMKGEMNYDLVIFGSSRSARAILASEVENELGVSSYNMSYQGSNTDFHEFIMRMYFTHNTVPKLVVLGMDDYNSFIREKTVFRADKLYPFTKYPEIIQELVDRREKIAGISTILSSHRINRRALLFQKRKPTKFNRLTTHGSIIIEGSEEKFMANQVEFDSLTIKYPFKEESDTLIQKYSDMIALCDSFKTELLIVVPPNYRPFTKEFRTRLEQLTSNRARIYYCDEEKAVYKDKQNFYDAEHLNVQGARYYTEDFIAFVKENYSFN